MKEHVTDHKGDVAKDHELSFAVMNLISIEEHLSFTAAKTGNDKYLAIQDQIRQLRSKYMRQIVKNEEGESWCIAKHLLATCIRFAETGVKHYFDGDKDTAMDLMNDAADTYQVFWLMQKMGGKDEKKVNDGKSKK